MSRGGTARALIGGFDGRELWLVRRLSHNSRIWGGLTSKQAYSVIGDH
jgi:hypothetical protein